MMIAIQDVARKLTCLLQLDVTPSVHLFSCRPFVCKNHRETCVPGIERPNAPRGRRSIAIAAF